MLTHNYMCMRTCARTQHAPAARMHVCLQVRVCTHRHTHTLTYIYTYTHTYACSHARTHTYTHPAQTHTHMHTHKCAHTYTSCMPRSTVSTGKQLLNTWWARSRQLAPKLYQQVDTCKPLISTLPKPASCPPSWRWPADVAPARVPITFFAVLML